MRNIFIFISTLFFLASCTTGGEDANSIRIKVQAEDTTKIIQLYRIEQGEKVLLDEYDFQGKGGSHTFIDTTSSHAFYILTQKHNGRKVYARKGQEVSSYVKGGQIELRDLSEENEALQRWDILAERVRQLSTEYKNKFQRELVEFTPFYEAQRKLEKESTSFLEELKKCEDSFFVKAMTVCVNAEINYYKLYNPQMPVIKALVKDYPEDLYNTIISPERLNDKVLLSVFEHTLPYVILYGAWSQRQEHLIEKKMPKPMVEYIPSPEIQTAYLLYLVRIDKKGQRLKYVEENYKHLFESGYALEELNKLRKASEMQGSSEQMKTIKLKNKKGEMVNMFDYTGKILVVDAWATWCGPCMKQRPSFEKLAHELKDENVTFLSISLDQSALKWEQVAEKSDLIELLDVNKEFSQAYGVTSIPHFIIFDKEGNVIDSPADKPSTGGLKARIEELLAKEKK